jgi:hypothetical protein
MALLFFGSKFLVNGPRSSCISCQHTISFQFAIHSKIPGTKTSNYPTSFVSKSLHQTVVVWCDGDLQHNSRRVADDGLNFGPEAAFDFGFEVDNCLCYQREAVGGCHHQANKEWRMISSPRSPFVLCPEGSYPQLACQPAKGWLPRRRFRTFDNYESVMSISNIVRLIVEVTCHRPPLCRTPSKTRPEERSWELLERVPGTPSD